MALIAESRHTETLFGIRATVSENVWCFVSYNAFSQDTLMHNAAEPAQSFSAMKRKYNFVSLAEELWRGTRKSQRGFTTWWRRLRDRGRTAMISLSSLHSHICSCYMHTFLLWCARAASHCKEAVMFHSPLVPGIQGSIGVEEKEEKQG